MENYAIYLDNIPVKCFSDKNSFEKAWKSYREKYPNRVWYTVWDD